MIEEVLREAEEQMDGVLVVAERGLVVLFPDLTCPESAVDVVELVDDAALRSEEARRAEDWLSDAVAHRVVALHDMHKRMAPDAPET